MNRHDVINTLQQLYTRQADRDHEIGQEIEYRTVELDDNNDSECPILDSFHNKNSNEAIMALTGLTALELRLLYINLHEFIVANCNVGRRR